MTIVWERPKNELILLHCKSDVIKLVNKLGFKNIEELKSRGIYVSENAIRETIVESVFPVFSAEGKPREVTKNIINTNIKNGRKAIKIVNKFFVRLSENYEFPCVAHIWEDSVYGRGGSETFRIWSVTPLSRMNTIDSLEERDNAYSGIAQERLEWAIKAQSENCNVE